MIMVFSAAGCVKDTYDMNKLSKKAVYSPTMAISAVKGGVSLSDMIKASDTVVFDQNKFVKLVFKKDSVINLKLADFYDLTNMVAFSQTYAMGALTIDPFQATYSYTLGQISSKISPAPVPSFASLDNGVKHPWPGFPAVNMGEKTFTGITNFQNAVFKSGFLDISITNNLPASINSINVNLFNTTGHTAIGGLVTIPPISAGQTSVASIDLTNQTVTNSIIAAIVLTGSVANATPVTISLNNNNIQITIKGRALIVKSGRIILPSQTVSSLNNKDTLTFSAGSGVEITGLKVTTGNLSYNIKAVSELTAALTISLPSTLRSGIPVSQVINIGPSAQFAGTILFDNTTVDMSKDVLKPFNRLPMTYGIVVNSNNTMINFNSTDNIKLDIKLLNPVFDYAKGYFGQQVETIAPDSLDLGIADVLSHLTGSFLISSPSIKINYSNSFAIPMQVTFNGTGIRKNKSNVNLGLATQTITPATFAARDVSAVITVDKTTSKIDSLISMPPEKIRFSGSAKMNPAGNTGLRDNYYVFGNSRLLASLDIEVPLEFRMNNLQFVDTVDNFLKSSSGSSSSFKPEDFKLLRIDITAQNGFPLGISLKMSLYDPITHTIKSTIDATDLLKAAPIDSNGKSSGTTETTTHIEFTQEFFSSVSTTDKIIFKFGLITSENGTKDVKIYSDNRIDYNAALVVQPVINIKLK